MHQDLRFYKGKLEFRKSDVSPGKTKVKQVKFVEFIYPGDLEKPINHKT